MNDSDKLRNEPFRLIRSLGHGGFADAWYAEVLDIRLRKKWNTDHVALKIPKDKPKELTLMKEAITFSNVTLAMREHDGAENVVRYLDVEIHQDKYVLVMEYVPNGSLRDVMGRLGRPRTPLPLDKAFCYLNGILKGLSAIHHARVFHRDIKPENVLLNGQSPKIADLGIATMLQSNDFASTAVGTLAYMSPEMLGPDGASFASDVWAAGVTAYEMFTGQWPFGDELTPMGPMINLILNQEPVSLRKRRPEVPEGVEKAILRALEKDPRKRYATPADMLKDVQAAQHVTSVRVRDAGGGVKTKSESLPARTEPAEGTATSPAKPVNAEVQIVDVDQELTRLRQMAQAQENNAKVEAGFKNLVKQHPQNVKIYSALGEFYNRQMRFDLAASAFKDGLKVDPRNAPLLWHLGMANEKIGRLAEARTALESAVRAGLDRKLEVHALIVLRKLRS